MPAAGYPDASNARMVLEGCYETCATPMDNVDTTLATLLPTNDAL